MNWSGGGGENGEEMPSEKGAVPVKARAVKLGYPSITYSRSYFQHFLPSCLMQTWLFSIHVSC